LFENLPVLLLVVTGDMYTQDGIFSFTQSFQCGGMGWNRERAFIYDLVTGKLLGFSDLFEGFYGQEDESIATSKLIVNQDVINILEKHYRNDRNEEWWKDCKKEVEQMKHGSFYIKDAARLGFVFQVFQGHCTGAVPVIIPISELRPYFKKDGVLSRIK
jgi:hypothetical protein